MNADHKIRLGNSSIGWKVILVGLTCPLLLTALAGGGGAGPRGDSFDLSWHTIDGGGGTSSGEDFELSGTIGQPDAGTLAGADYELAGGFWPGVTPAIEEPCEGDANGDGTVDPLDSGFVLARFGCTFPEDGENCLAADVNGDGEVNPLDSGYVLARFGECP